MYLVEQILKTFKTYIWNKVRPETSMAKGYIYDQTLGLSCIEYMQKFMHVQHQTWDANEKNKMCDEMLRNIIIMFILLKCVKI
jgi:hypothetical protein